MAVYFEARAEAEDAIRVGFVCGCELPVFFGKIFLFQEEKWMIDFDTRDYRFAAFLVIESHSHRICELLAMADPEHS